MIIAFNKPYGVLCQFTPDRPDQRTLADFGFPKDVYPLGRLDMDSEGLLLLSDENGLNNRLLNPKNAHTRTYLVQVEGVPIPDALERLTDGSITIQKHRCLPCRAEIVESTPTIPPRDPPIRVRKFILDTWMKISLEEGKNRQVRRMTAAIGHPTLRLLRISIGNLQLPNLEQGEWKILDEAEKQIFGT